MLTTKNHGTLIPKKMCKMMCHVQDDEIRTKGIFGMCDCMPAPILTAPESNHVNSEIQSVSI